MHSLAELYVAQDRYDDAENLHNKTLKIQRRVLGEEHPDTLASMNTLAALYQHQGRFEEAESLLVKLVTLRRQHDTLDPSARWLAGLGSCLLDQKKYNEAEPILREALVIREKKQPDNWVRFDTMSLVGATLTGKAQALRLTNVETAEQVFTEAETLLIAGYEGMKQREAKIPAYYKDRLTTSLERLIELCEAWGKPEQASPWQQKLENK